MSVKYILYNPYAGKTGAMESVKALQASCEDTVAINICRITNYKTFFNGLEPDASLILCGGDGTLNYFVNEVYGIDIKNEIYYLPIGTGNDFARDIGCAAYAKPTVCINQYLRELPVVTVNGNSHLFLNNVGFGIDGYCCETGDKLREENKKRKKAKEVNYTKIAFSGLLLHYKPRNAFIHVDGKEYAYKNVWLASVMNGKFYGGGMMAAPEQNRLAEDGKVSLIIIHDAGKLRALAFFPSIFKGKHTKYNKYATILKGDFIQVRFDTPTPIQIDGETLSDIVSYQVSSSHVKAETHPGFSTVGVAR